MESLFQTIVTIVLFVLILGSLVLIHEVGHFIIARLARVRVLEFGIGFPPRARVLRSSGDTLYTLNWLPIGGFVKLEGEDGDEELDPRSFTAQPLLLRILILVAGVAMNFVLSFAIFAGIALMGDPTLGIRAGTVQPGSPAEGVGLRPGDVIESVNGRYFSAFGTLSLLDDLRTRAGETVTIRVLRTDGTRENLEVTLRSRAEVEKDQGALGISGLEGRTTDVSLGHSPDEAIRLGVDRTVAATTLVLGGLGQLADAMINRPTEPPPAAGPVGIAAQIGSVFWALGPVVTLYLAGVLSANLGVVNILPIPPLDGGRILILLIRSIFGSRVSVRAERLTYFVGFVFLFVFLIWITGFDIGRQFFGG